MATRTYCADYLNQGTKSTTHSSARVGLPSSTPAKAGSDNALRVLIFECHANINKIANGGIYAIYTAAFHSHPKCMQVFLEAGLDINAASGSGMTSLHWAANEGSIDAARFLVEQGVDVFLEEFDTRMRLV